MLCLIIRISTDCNQVPSLHKISSFIVLSLIKNKYYVYYHNVINYNHVLWNGQNIINSILIFYFI